MESIANTTTDVENSLSELIDNAVNKNCSLDILNENSELSDIETLTTKDNINENDITNPLSPTKESDLDLEPINTSSNLDSIPDFETNCDSSEVNVVEGSSKTDDTVSEENVVEESSTVEETSSKIDDIINETEETKKDDKEDKDLSEEQTKEDEKMDVDQTDDTIIENDEKMDVDQPVNKPIENDKSGDDSTDSDKVEEEEKINSTLDETDDKVDTSFDDGNRTTEFVQVNPETDKDIDEEDNEKDQDKEPIIEEDPIGADCFDAPTEDTQGTDAELCIIPDAERVITQEEKDAAATIPPLKDIASTTELQNSTETPKEVNIIVNQFTEDSLHICNICSLQRKVKFTFEEDDKCQYICDDKCLTELKNNKGDKVTLSWEESGLRVKDFSAPKEDAPVEITPRTCSSCKKVIANEETNLSWEMMDFCDETCLTNYQKDTGSKCSTCYLQVKETSLGKYSVRFGSEIKQFCTSKCLEEYKKGLKVCSYCQQDMSKMQGFLAPVGDKGHFKDFCSQTCMDKYDIMTNNRPPKVDAATKCSVCKTDKPITIEFDLDDKTNYFCGEPCFVAFSFVNNVSSGKCGMCKRNFQKKVLDKHTMYYDNNSYSFCSDSCQNIYIIAHRKIVSCSWCKVKKYNFDMILRYCKGTPQINMCSVNCLNLYHTSLGMLTPNENECNFCHKPLPALFQITMTDNSVRNFCSNSCVTSFQTDLPKQAAIFNRLNETQCPLPVGPARKIDNLTNDVSAETDPSRLPLITNIQSLATNGTVGTNTKTTRSKTLQNNLNLSDLSSVVQIKQHYIFKQAPMPEQRNMGTMCKVKSLSKTTQSKPTMVNKEVQTESHGAEKILIPIPVPIYVPAPMHMFAAPVPFPVPFPLPIPVPIFIPTTRNSANGIMKEIKKIQVKMPTDPYEAELLMMAEMVAGEKKEDPTDSESDVDDTAAGDDGTFSPEPVDASNAFGDDMLQMALKMATELDEPAVDLEGALTANTITAPQGGEAPPEETVDDPQPTIQHMIDRQQQQQPLRGRKRAARQSKNFAGKRKRRSSQSVDMPLLQPPTQPAVPAEPVEKPDANMCLKYTFGVNAWKQWVTTKNAELEKSSRVMKLFKTEILQLTADELNYSLCLFVKEVRKPNGAEYAPDTIYYLCLGIQQYLFENGRIDNIFCDPYYEKFTDCLDEVAKKFSVLYNDSHYIVTRVEEEHLWESKQLGAHSPHVLLSTLMFFNTKHFNLTTVDEHMQLSFSHIMKHWKRNPNQPGATKLPGSRNVLLRFYPPQSAIQNNLKKKKVYEQQENEDNPLRCPVKLYEFYLSKCPESVKTRNDVFYLQPERSCVPDSPVWYSTMPLPREALEKMLHRVKMVKEINVALLTT